MVIELAHGTTRDLQALLDSKVDATISNYDVATLCACRDDARYYRGSLRVENRELCAEEVRYVARKVRVDICKALLFMTRRRIESKTDAPMVP